MSLSGDRRTPLALFALLLIYSTLGEAWQRAVPLFEAPDEPSHVQYVAFLHEAGRPPRMIGRPEVPGEGMQPPLYYALLQPLFAAISRSDPQLVETLDQANLWIYRFADLREGPADARIRMRGTTQGTGHVLQVSPELEYLRALRWGSLGMGALALAFTFVASRLASGQLPFALLCTALFAFSPQFLFVSAYVNNDVACAALGAAAFLVFALALARGRVGRGSYLAAAGLVGVAFATKHSALPAAAVCALALFLLDRRPLPARLRDVAPALALALLLIAPSLWLNQQRFGGVLGVSSVLESSDTLEQHERDGGLVTYLLRIYPHTTFRTYWATFGWMNVLVSDSVYLVFFALCWTGLLGLFLGWRAERASEGAASSDDGSASGLRRIRALRGYALATVLATLAAHLWINSQVLAAQGRHLFGAAPHFAALLALGLGCLAGGQGLAPGWRLAGGIALGMGLLAWYALVHVLPAAYG